MADRKTHEALFELIGNERLITQSEGSVGVVKGMVALTSGRLIGVSRTIGSPKAVIINLRDIMTVEWVGMATTRLAHQLHVSARSGEFSFGLPRKVGPGWPNKILAAQSALADRPVEVLHHDAVPTQSLTEQLERLFELHEKGVLTDDEWATAKSRLLA